MSAPLIVADLKDDVPNVSGLNVTGSILLSTSRSLRAFWDWVHGTGSRLGLKAVIIQDGDENGIGGLSRFPRKTPLPFPVVAVDRKTSDTVAARRNETLFATLDDISGPNNYETELNTGLFWFFRVFLPITSFAMAMMGVGRLIQLRVESGEWTMSVMTAAILLETVGSVLRFIYWAIDPLGASIIFTDNARNVWHTVSIPFAINSTLLLTIYWHETVSHTSVKFSWSIERFKLPTYMLFIAIFLVEIVIDALILFFPTKLASLAIINSAIYLVIGISLSIFFIVTASRILCKLSGVRTRAEKQITPVAVKLMVISFSWFCILGSGIVSTTSYFARYMPSYIIYTWATLHLFLTMKAFATISAVRTSKAKRSSKSGERMGSPSSGAQRGTITSSSAGSGSISISP